jgi:hypothetical protein
MHGKFQLWQAGGSHWIAKKGLNMPDFLQTSRRGSRLSVARAGCHKERWSGSVVEVEWGGLPGIAEATCPIEGAEAKLREPGDIVLVVLA